MANWGSHHLEECLADLTRRKRPDKEASADPGCCDCTICSKKAGTDTHESHGCREYLQGSVESHLEAYARWASRQRGRIRRYRAKAASPP